MGLLLFLFGTLAAISPAQEPAPLTGGTREATATLDDGRTFVGSLTGGASPAFLVRPAGPEIPAARIREVRFREELASARTGPPVQRVTLRGGDQLTCQVLSVGQQTARLALFQGAPREVPSACLTGIWQRPQHALWLYEGCEGERTVWSTTRPPLGLDAKGAASGRRGLRLDPAAQTVTCQLPGTLESGHVEFGFSESASINPRWEWLIEFGFGGRLVEVVPGWSDANVSVHSGQGPLAVQPLKRRKGWRGLRLSLTATQMQIEIDGAVLAQGDRPPTGLDSLRLVVRPLPAAGAGDLPEPVYLDDLKIYRGLAPLPARRRQPLEEILTLTAGDEIYGKLESGSASEIGLSGPFGSQAFPLGEVRSLELRAQRPPASSVSGWRVRAWLRSSEPPPATAGADEPLSALDRLTGALVEAGDNDVTIQHPWLGRVAVPWALVERLETLGHGTRWELDPLFHHLGNDPRRDFPAIAPEGPDLKVEFEWDPSRAPAGTVWLCLDTVDLESFDSQHAKSLRAGHLATSVLLNDQLLEGTLNRHIQQAKQRVRLPLAAGLLKSGVNRILIHAKPAENDPNELDDFGIDGVALETDSRPPR